MEMSFTDKVKFTEPLIDLEMPGISLRKLIKNHKQILSRLYETREPVVLTIEKQSVLLCDPRGYYELECKRHTLFQLFIDLEEALKTAPVEFNEPDLRELEDLRLRAAESKRRLKDLKREKRGESENLSLIQQRIAVVEASLKARDQKSEDSP
jgi:hypothetical protein